MLDALVPVLGISAIVGVIAVSVIIVRFASAFAKRLEARPPDVASPDPAIGELREELGALHERLDFIERVLAQREQRERALPQKSAEPEPRVRTPS